MIVLTGFPCISEVKYNMVSADAVELALALSVYLVAGSSRWRGVDVGAIPADHMSEYIQVEVVATPVYLKVVWQLIVITV